MRKWVVCPTAEIILSTLQFFPLYLCLNHASPFCHLMLLLVFIVEKLKVWFGDVKTTGRFELAVCLAAWDMK